MLIYILLGKFASLEAFRPSEIPRMLPLVAQQLSEIQAPHKLYAKVPTWSRGGVFCKLPPPKKDGCLRL